MVKSVFNGKYFEFKPEGIGGHDSGSDIYSLTPIDFNAKNKCENCGKELGLDEWLHCVGTNITTDGKMHFRYSHVHCGRPDPF